MEILDLLGNKNRLEILKKLTQKPRYITELSEELGVGRKAIIDHLRILENYGLIEDSKNPGRRKYYQISNNFVFKFILTKNNSITYYEDLDLDKNKEEKIKDKFKDLKKLERKINNKNKFKETFSLLREIETKLEELHTAEIFLSNKIDELIKETTQEINEETNNALEKKILQEILRNGQITPEEVSSKLKIKRNKVFSIISNLRKKDLI